MTSPGSNTRFTTEPVLRSRKVPETPLKTGSASSSSVSTEYTFGVSSGYRRPLPSSLLLVSAPVGHETMHSPQETQLELLMGWLASKAMVVK